MKINRPQIHPINPYQANEMKVKQTTKEQTYPTDKLEISSAAKELSEVTAHSLKRTEHVEQIKQQVQSGNYEVNHEKVAKALLNYFR